MPSLEKFCTVEANLDMRMIGQSPAGMRIDFPFEGTATSEHWEGERTVRGMDYVTVRADGKAAFQPVWVEDVVTWIIGALDDPDSLMIPMFPPAGTPCPTITESQLVSVNSSLCSRKIRPLRRNMSSL